MRDQEYVSKDTHAQSYLIGGSRLIVDPFIDMMYSEYPNLMQWCIENNNNRERYKRGTGAKSRHKRYRPPNRDITPPNVDLGKETGTSAHGGKKANQHYHIARKRFGI